MYKKLLLCLITLTALNNSLYGSMEPQTTICHALCSGAFHGSLAAMLFSLPSLNASYINLCSKIGLIVGSTTSLASLAFRANIPTFFRENPRYRSMTYEHMYGSYIAQRGGMIGGAAGTLIGLLAVGCHYAGFTVEDLKNALR